MEKLGSWIDSAKQMAQNAIKDKLELGSALSGQILLNMLHDAFIEMPDSKRDELFKVMESIFVQYKSQDKFDFEGVWRTTIRHPLVQELAGNVSRNLIKAIISKARM
ncbi:MAG TPA: hypothetical protein VE954_23025 [Oligoflexus sp.]|uniref:hypothetical protein n=1 Tax=Oligoflexus sp. TaxID=1971216 RepID=UPI002D2CE726|nr:hypothetical protein [Oligoflexus sp.]HYX35985.1 hypothetical protein [Oligoflexus sp.]